MQVATCVKIVGTSQHCDCVHYPLRTFEGNRLSRKPYKLSHR